MKYILDTNIISELINTKPNPNVIAFLDTLNEKDIYLTVITIGEIYFGIEKLPSGKKKDKLLTWLQDNLLPRFEDKIIDIDTQTMLHWGTLTNNLKSKGTPLPLMDSLIASSCLAKGFTLITRNEKDFANTNLKIIFY